MYEWASGSSVCIAEDVSVTITTDAPSGDSSKKFDSVKDKIVSKSSSYRKSVLDHHMFQISVPLYVDHPIFCNILQKAITKGANIEAVFFLITTVTIYLFYVI